LTLLAKYPRAPLLIEGHTDSVGSDPSNQVLSKNRADAVKRWLVDHGIPSGLITARGRGQTAPIASNGTAEGRQKNRRVEIRIQK
jgi:outer membrane protein OmpA-like peptidoglycan-associated protein